MHFCVVIFCPDLETTKRNNSLVDQYPTNATAGNYSYTTQHVFDCRRGYRISENDSSNTTCQANATWSTPDPECDRMLIITLDKHEKLNLSVPLQLPLVLAIHCLVHSIESQNSFLVVHRDN